MASPHCTSAAARGVTAVARATAHPQVVWKPHTPNQPCRRAMLAGLVAVPALQLGATTPAFAKDFKEAQAEKEARKKALREAAGEIKSTGVDVPQVFQVPEYSVSEEARTPNVHSRQGEGARSQRNI